MQIDRLRSDDGSLPISATSDDYRVHIWDVHFETTSTEALLAEACAHRLVDISKLSRDDMRLLARASDRLSPFSLDLR